MVYDKLIAQEPTPEGDTPEGDTPETPETDAPTVTSQETPEGEETPKEGKDEGGEQTE